MSIVKLEEFRCARDFLQVLPSIYKALDAAQTSLQSHSHYRPVGLVLRALADQRLILYGHEQNARKILTDEKYNPTKHQDQP